MVPLARRYKVTLDLGSHKLGSCVCADPFDHRLGVLTKVASRGLTAAGLKDVSHLEEDLLNLIYETEKHSGAQVRSACVTLGASFFSSQYVSASVSLPHKAVQASDIQRLAQSLKRPDSAIIHLVPIDFSVDQQRGLENPLYAVGSELKGVFHVLSMEKGLFETLWSCFKRCQIQVTQILNGAYTSALACLSPEEQNLGAVVCDIGAGTTGMSVIKNRRIVRAQSFAMGGRHVTADIAQGCSLPWQQSERLKILHGAALALSAYDGRESVECLSLENEVCSLSKAFLIKIIQARYEEILFHIAKALKDIPYPLATQRVVFTGGGSQIPGLRELAQRCLSGHVRIGNPLGHWPKGMEEEKKSSVLCANDMASVIGAHFYHGFPLDPFVISNKKRNNFFAWIKKNYDIIMNQ